YYASVAVLQLVITESAASITSNIIQHNNQILQIDGNAGFQWAAQNGGHDEAALRLKRAASVLSRIKREMIRQRSAAGPVIQQLCNQFNIFFTYPNLAQMNQQNVNLNCTTATFVLAQMAIAINQQSTAALNAVRQARTINANAQQAGNANAQQLLSIQTCELIMQCINSTMEPLGRDNPTFDMIEQYFLKSMNPAAANQPPGTILQTFPRIESIYCVKQNDFEARFQECLAEQNRLLLWHGSGVGCWVSILSTGLYLPGNTSYVSYGPGFARPNGTYGIFFADMAQKAQGYTATGVADPNIIYFGLFDVCLGQEYPYQGGVAQPAGARHISYKYAGGRQPNQAQNMNLGGNLNIPIGDVAGGGRANEYIIINPEQAKLMYLVRVRNG
ncbi:MAG: hypothetical protein EZS28_031488, partial [Streblomastix strix]